MTPARNAAPFFSIVVCCWNSMPYIRECVASIRGQTLQDLEIVFVDGGSSDGTLDFVESVAARKKVLQGVRGGIATAMNAGIRAATGEVIAHLHADDYYIGDGVLERVHAVFGGAGAPAWVYGRFKNDIDGRVDDPPYPVRTYSRRALMRRNIIPHCATFVRRRLFEEVGLFDTRFRLAMDYEMWLRIASRHEPVQLDDYLGVFRRHGGSATTMHRVRSFNEDFLARFRHAPVWLWPEFAARYLYRRAREV